MTVIHYGMLQKNTYFTHTQKNIRTEFSSKSAEQ